MIQDGDQDILIKHNTLEVFYNNIKYQVEKKSERDTQFCVSYYIKIDGHYFLRQLSVTQQTDESVEILFNRVWEMFLEATTEYSINDLYVGTW